MPARRLRAATRGSELARWQTGHVAALLAPLGVILEPVVVSTTADRRLDVPIWAMGGKGAFVAEVRAAVLDGRAELAVHSAKDLPSVPAEGLALAAVPERADPRDVLVGATLDALAPGATVATGSARRRVQLAWRRPDLTFADLRGNIATRLGKIPAGGAVVVAAAALDRLGVELGPQPAEVLDPAVMLPQVGQGALAVECRDGDEELRVLLARVEHRASRLAVDVERAFLAELGGDCDLPAAAHARVGADGEVGLEALLASPDGHVLIRHRWSGDAPDLGRVAARFLLDEAGGRSLLQR